VMSPLVLQSRAAVVDRIARDLCAGFCFVQVSVSAAHARTRLFAKAIHPAVVARIAPSALHDLRESRYPIMCA